MNSLASRPAPDCLLSIVLPQSLEEEVLDVLMAHTDLAPGFTVLHGHGMGSHVELASAMERVQGRARRVLVQVAIAQHNLQPLIDLLNKTLQTPQAAYWAVPLLAFGRFGAAV